MNPSTLSNAAAQPFVATTFMALALGLLAVVHGALWWRDREDGMGWFALGMALMALFAATSDLHRPSGPYLPWSPWYLVLVAGLMVLALGLVDYLKMAPMVRRIAWAATLLPSVAYGVLVTWVGLTDARIPRSLAQLPVGLTFLALAALAGWAARREPGAGHGVVAASLLAIPAIAIAISLAGLNSVALRSFAFGPLIVLALMLVPASLWRRRRALEAEVGRRRAAEDELTRLNASLEHAVAERTADLRELVAGLESFNRSVSHDLRGSLGGITGLAKLAHEALLLGDDKPARSALPLIAKEASGMTRLVAALLSLAKVGDATLRPETVDLGRLAREVVDGLALQQGGGQGPRIEVAAAMPAVHADAELLKVVLTNLIGNAIKFTRGVEAGRVEIGALRAGGAVEVFVRDNGVGFDADAAARLFMPFERLHPEGFEGHGVGLSIVRRAVERHGGRVWAEGRPGHGATFRFSLPD